MTKYLKDVLFDVANEKLRWTDGFGGANQNLWTIALASDADVSVSELIAFAHRARDVRRDQAVRSKKSPVTFYMWTDEQAGQLRFSVCSRPPSALPFGCVVKLTEKPDDVVEEYLHSPFRDGIPLAALTESTTDDDAEDSEDAFELLVWAETIA